MIKVTKLVEVGNNLYRISATADTKAEVATGKLIGLPEGANIDMDSTMMTAKGELAFMQSDGTWSWL